MQRNNKSILITGGMGYVGSHTATLLLDAGYDVVIVDNCANSFPDTLERIRKISPGNVEWVNADVSNRDEMGSVFARHQFAGIIHFAAYVSIPESVAAPDKYYANNIGTLATVLHFATQDGKSIPLVFSSSAAVYGNSGKMPLREDEPLALPPSPYAVTKQKGESMLRDYVSTHGGKAVALRYFNPAGGHPSGLLGEQYRMPVFHLVPAMCEAAAGLRKELVIFGDDYPTPDGTCIRDYVHVMDVAQAHVAALAHVDTQAENYFEVFNIGSGSGYSVKTMLDEFQKVNSVSVPFKYADRRAGDPACLVADTQKARDILKWEPHYTLTDMLRTAWQWQKSGLNALS
ncbi:UDP-glucose 4-epimerase GalE [Candidatus Parcubacteria bacterium]|nr:MAG: UDP-glucose 4-epimerase GalE [Candidatus Parcubacteria bacterium]